MLGFKVCGQVMNHENFSQFESISGGGGERGKTKTPAIQHIPP